MTAAESLRRGVAILATLVLVLSVLALPASAAPAKGTASVVALESFAPGAVYAGTPDQAFEVTVTNASDLGNLLSPVDWIEIDPTSDFTVLSASGPGDWVAEQRDGRIIFTGDTLGSGSSATFTLTSAVGRPEGDIALPWKVSASNDGGNTATAYDPSEAGALSPAIHVLQVISNSFTAPPLAIDGDATEGQVVDGQVEIQNLGSGTLDVTPSLSSSNADVPALAPVSVGPEGTAIVPWTATLGNPGTARITADAVGETTSSAGWPMSDAPVSKSTIDLAVLEAADFSYLEDTLSPQVVGSASATTINVTLDLENLGGVLVDPIDPSSELSITVAGQTLTAGIADPAALGAGESSTFTFSGLAVPAGLAGEESPVVTIVGTDQNGMAVSESITIPDTIEFDPIAPVLELVAGIPTTMVNGEDDAATTGTPFDITGTVTDDGAGCGDCPVTATLIEMPGSISTPIELQNDGAGNLSATADHTFDPSTTSAKVVGTAADGAENSTSQSQADTGSFPVDLVAPSELEAVTGGPDGQDLRRIDITLDERTAFPQRLSQADFDVEGHTVTGVSYVDSRGIDNNDATAQGNTDPIGDAIVLTLGEDLGEDETPVVTFSTSFVNDEPYDRVGLLLGGFEIEALDGIIPGLPVLDTIGGLGEYDDPNDSYEEPRFFTNQQTPTVVVSDVDAGHTVRIYEDTDQDGTLDPGTDTELGSGEALQAGTVEIVLNDLGTSNRDLTLFSQATDAGGNPGLVAADGLTVDTLVPTFDVFTTDEAAREVNVAFSETLRGGRDAVADWVVEVVQFGRYFSLARDEVTGEYGSRTISIADDESNWNGEVARLSYDFTGGEGERYFDRAGNQLGDFATP